jgi:hypothetical protein
LFPHCSFDGKGGLYTLAQDLKVSPYLVASMSQAVMQEVNMDVFARRIAPYFSWLESRIESGWTQNEHITKDVLKETKMLSTNMRARFILGVAKDDFVQEVQRALELFELAADAFPDECDEIESKSESLVKGIAEELGHQFLPGQTSVVIDKPKTVESPKIEPMKIEKNEEISTKPAPKIEKLPKIEKVEPKVEKPKVEVKKVAVKKQVKKAKPKVEKTPKVAKPEPKVTKKEFKMPKIRMPALPKINLPTVKMPSIPKFKISKKSVRNFGPVKWVREFIFGED